MMAQSVHSIARSTMYYRIFWSSINQHWMCIIKTLHFVQCVAQYCLVQNTWIKESLNLIFSQKVCPRWLANELYLLEFCSSIFVKLHQENSNDFLKNFRDFCPVTRRRVNTKGIAKMDVLTLMRFFWALTGTNLIRIAKPRKILFDLTWPDRNNNCIPSQLLLSTLCAVLLMGAKGGATFLRNFQKGYKSRFTLHRKLSKFIQKLLSYTVLFLVYVYCLF